MAQRSLAKRMWYDGLQVLARLAGIALFRIRWRGRQHIPRGGGVLVLSNHQSHFDPVLVGMACDRRLNYVARQSLFGFLPFRWLIYSLDAIPIDRDGLGMSGLKETLRRLKREEMVLLFPEGTRTRDGDVQRLKPGFNALAKRAGVPLLPVAIDGAWQAWPRSRATPWMDVVHVQIGRPIMPEEIARFNERELVDEVERRLRDCLSEARRLRRRSMLSRR